MRISGNGFLLPIILIPYALVFLAESFAWRLTIRHTPRPGVGKLYLIRMATDAILYSIPGGVAVAEPMRPVLLQRQCGIDLTEGIGSCIITKINIAVAQALFIFLGFILVMVFYPGVSLQLGIEGGPAGYSWSALSWSCHRIVDPAIQRTALVTTHSSPFPHPPGPVAEAHREI